MPFVTQFEIRNGKWIIKSTQIYPLDLNNVPEKLKEQVRVLLKDVDDLKRDTKDNSKRINILIERISRNKKSSEQTHKRIDKVNKK